MIVSYRPVAAVRASRQSPSSAPDPAHSGPPTRPDAPRQLSPQPAQQPPPERPSGP